MTRIVQRHDTSTNWTSVNPILASGEMGVETDTGKFKFGDGQNAWVSLPYAGGSSETTPIATTTSVGTVKPDGTTITILEDGTISSVGGSSEPVDAYTKAETDSLLEGKENKITPVSPLSLEKLSSPVKINGDNFQYVVEGFTPSYTGDGPAYATSYEPKNITLPTTISGNGILDLSKIIYYIGDLRNIEVKLPSQYAIDTMGSVKFQLVVGNLKNDNSFTPKMVFNNPCFIINDTPAITGGELRGGIDVTNWNKGTTRDIGTQTDFGGDGNAYLRISTRTDNKITIASSFSTDNVYPYAGVTKTFTTDINNEDFNYNCLIFCLPANKDIPLSSVSISRNNEIIWTPTDIKGQNQLSLAIDNQTIQVNSQGQLACNLDEIGNDLTGKANIDLSNLTDAGKQVIKDNAGGSAPTNMVTTDTDQTISGTKTFTGVVKALAFVGEKEVILQNPNADCFVNRNTFQTIVGNNYATDQCYTQLNGYHIYTKRGSNPLAEIIDDGILGNYVDGTTITYDSATKKLSSISTFKQVKLTQAEYDAIATKDENTMYVIVG